MKRILVALVLSTLTASFAPAQTMAEAAQKEKERREGLQGKTVTVVSNADLSKTKKKPAASPPTAGDTQAQTQAPAGGEAAVKAAADADARLKADVEKRYLEMKTELEDRAAKAKERAELLALKLKALQQKFMTFNSMQSKEPLQREIVQTYEMIQAAGAEQVRAKDDLEKFLASAARDKAAAVGIK